MNQTIAQVTLVVRDYDEAIAFYTQKLSFTLVADTPLPEEQKRWVVAAPPGGGTGILLARASKPEQEAFIGNQSGRPGVLVSQHRRFLAGLPPDGKGWHPLCAAAPKDRLRHRSRICGFVRQPLGFGPVPETGESGSFLKRRDVCVYRCGTLFALCKL